MAALLAVGVVAYALIDPGKDGLSETVVSPDRGAVLEHESGVRVEFPPGAVAEPTTARVRWADDPPADDANTLLVGDVFDIDVAGPAIFAEPVTLTVPYDPALIPGERSEAEVFAVYWDDGAWHPLYGTVDEDANTVTVLTTHFTPVGGGIEKAPEALTPDERARLVALAGVPENVALASQRDADLAAACETSWAAMEDAVNEYQEITDELAEPIRAVFRLTKKAAAQTAYKSGATKTGAKKLLLRAGGAVLGIYNAIEGTVELIDFTVTAATAHLLAAQSQSDCAGVEEAGCVLYALENPTLDIRGRCVPYIRWYINNTGIDAYPPPEVTGDFEAPPPPRDIPKFRDLRSAVLHADLALHTKDVNDWLRLTEPTSPYDAQLALAQDVVREIAGYDFACVGILPRTTDVLGDTAGLLYRASGPSGDELFHIVVASPLDDPYYRYLVASVGFTQWDPAWTDTVPDEVPCLPEMSQDTTTTALGPWTQLSLDAATGTGAMIDVVAGGPGFVAVGADPEGNGTDAAFWHSEDGTTWSRIVDAALLEDGGQVVQAVASRGALETLYAVGSDGEGAAVWISPDGMFWARTGDAALEAPEGRLFMEDLAPLGTTDLVGVGGGPDGAAVWATDGGRWIRVDIDDGGHMLGVARSIAGMVAVGARFTPETGTTAAVWLSADGATWTSVDSPAFAGGDSVTMVDVVAGGPGIVAVGVDDQLGHSDAAVWASPDGTTWERATDPALGGPGHQTIESVTTLGTGLIAVGHETIDDRTDPAVWFSADGLSWERVDDGAFRTSGDQAMHGVLTTPTFALAVGWEAVDGTLRPAVWISGADDVTGGCPAAPPPLDFASIGIPGFDAAGGTATSGLPLPPGTCHYHWGFTATSDTDTDSFGGLAEAAGFRCSSFQSGSLQRCSRAGDVVYLEISGDDFIIIDWFTSTRPPGIDPLLVEPDEIAAIGALSAFAASQEAVDLLGPPTSIEDDEMTGEQIPIWDYGGAGSVAKFFLSISARCDPRFGARFAMWGGIRMCESSVGQLIAAWGEPYYLATDGFNAEVDYLFCSEGETFDIRVRATPAYWESGRGLDQVDALTGAALRNPLTEVGIRSIWTLDADPEYIETLDVCNGAAPGPSVDDHGDDASSATFVGSGFVSGAIEPTYDQDWFAFPAEAGRVYTIETSETSTAGEPVDSILVLWGPDGATYIEENDDVEGCGCSRIVWTAPTTDTYYVAVLGYRVSVGVYELSISSAGPAPPPPTVAAAAGNILIAFANENADQVCRGPGPIACSAISGADEYAQDVALGDIDGNGYLDAVFAANPNRVCLQDPSGSLTCRPVSAETDATMGVALGDVNGDGNLDAVFANFDVANLANRGTANTLCLGDGTGRFSCGDISPDENRSFSVALGDVDGDGDLDAVFGNHKDAVTREQYNRVCLGNGAGSFICFDIVPSAEFPRTSVGVALGDLNRDGNLDAVFASLSLDDEVCLGDGSGGFDCSTIALGTFNLSQGVALGDVNEDGRLDAVFAVRSSGLCLGDGLGGFTCSDLPGQVGGAEDIALGDVDGDGHLDAVVAVHGGTGRPNQVCYGDGTGTFSCVDLTSIVANTEGVALGIEPR